jgi:hypothetical protein
MHTLPRRGTDGAAIVGDADRRKNMLPDLQIRRNRCRMACDAGYLPEATAKAKDKEKLGGQNNRGLQFPHSPEIRRTSLHLFPRGHSFWPRHVSHALSTVFGWVICAENHSESAAVSRGAGDSYPAVLGFDDGLGDAES